MITVRFIYITGIKRGLFHNARLSGTWNMWNDIPMREFIAEDGCPAFEVTVDYDDVLAGALECSAIDRGVNALMVGEGVTTSSLIPR